MDIAELEAFRRGDRAILERVYRLHLEEIERFVRRALSRANRLTAHNVADLVQEVFARAFSTTAREGYDAARDYSPFLWTIARNTLVDWLRRTRRDSSVALDENAAPGLCLQFDTGAASTYSLELVATVRSYVETLSPELRKVHELRFVAEEGQESAAKILCISRQNLRTLERRLLDGLRRRLAEPAPLPSYVQ